MERTIFGLVIALGIQQQRFAVYSSLLLSALPAYGRFSDAFKTHRNQGGTTWEGEHGGAGQYFTSFWLYRPS
jgi:hypothetical protein